jgi:predicted Fe-S protein YdhL (DUF1289 family)
MTAPEPMDETARRHIESPCTGICVIDPKTDLCKGCFRTLNEIATWDGSSVAERSQTLDRVERRKRQASG